MHNLVNNPLPGILKYLTLEPVFLDEKLISCVIEIVHSVTNVRINPAQVMHILESLEEAKYVEIHEINKLIKTIKKVKDGN